jgi:hypothetical protein
VMFSLTAPSTTGACGTLSATFGTTDAAGNVTVVYTTSTTGGAVAAPTTCRVIAQEANGAKDNSAAPTVISQTAVANTVGVIASPQSVSVASSGTSTVTVTITDGTGAVVSGDTVTFLLTPSVAGPPSSCGALTPAGPYVTNASGQVVVTYTAAGAVGFCTVKATDASPSAGSTAGQGAAVSGSVQITQSP